MIARVVSVIAGALILSAVAHVTVKATGGYGTDHSYLTLAIAFGVACGSVFCGRSWASERYTLALLFILCIVGGEAYGFLQTANRLLAGTEANQAPRREHSKEHARASARVKSAKAAVDNAPTTSRQLEKAEAAKAAADKAVVEKSAEPGCRANCRQLLQAQVDAAAGDVEKARTALEAGSSTKEMALRDAEAALTVMTPPELPTPLADRSGIPAWIIDLTVAALGSIAANGLACCLMIFGAHHSAPRVEIVEPAKAQSRKAPRPWTAKDHAARFGLACLNPGGAGAELESLRREYRRWCTAQGVMPLADSEIVPALVELFDNAGIAIEERGRRMVAVGVSLQGE